MCVVLCGHDVDVVGLVGGGEAAGAGGGFGVGGGEEVVDAGVSVGCRLCGLGRRCRPGEGAFARSGLCGHLLEDGACRQFSAWTVGGS